MTPPFLTGIKSLVDRYDVFIVDLWGTLHDGFEAYPGAVDALTRLEAAGKRVVLLSNAPRRVAAAERTLAAVGIAPHLYGLLITSGEAVHAALRDRPDAWHSKLNGPCWHLGPTRDRSIFEGLGLDVREKPEGAGFCVVTGANLDQEVVEDYKQDMDRALALGQPMICANPDIVVPVGNTLVVCAGAFAEYYASQGGDVYWHGKPHPPIYHRVFAGLEALGSGPVDPTRIIAIGDALATDIAGAAGAGLASGLVVGGVHGAELKLSWRGRPDKKALAALMETAAAKPDYVLRRFAW
jgi:HAD superfamily hydrolase (TIGR01459 family)